MAIAKRLVVTEAEYVAVINEWWRQYTYDPAAFAHTAQVVMEIINAGYVGEEPAVGQRDLAFFKVLLEKIRKVSAKRKARRSSAPRRR